MLVLSSSDWSFFLGDMVDQPWWDLRSRLSIAAQQVKSRRSTPYWLQRPTWTHALHTKCAQRWKTCASSTFTLALHHVNCCRNHQHCTWSFKGGRSRTLAHVDSRADKLHTEATLPWLLLLKGLFAQSPGYNNYLPVWFMNGFNSQLQFSLFFSSWNRNILKLSAAEACRVCNMLYHSWDAYELWGNTFQISIWWKTLFPRCAADSQNLKCCHLSVASFWRNMGLPKWENLDADGMVIDGQQLID